ncbi:MAG: hypothetical protein KatS3mg085_526 [Candidatus Dojkabacteria bacterium]|nr:MAG: hypothetical protein KatS3mg085_526 [Candidatus Dojkabacteria bacterium]
MNKKKFNFIVIPFIILVVILTTSILELTKFPEKNIINTIQIIGIIVGSIQLFNDTIKEIFKKKSSARLYCYISDSYKFNNRRIFCGIDNCINVVRRKCS